MSGSFLEIAVELRLISNAQSKQLKSESTATGKSPAELALDQGLMQAVDVDIVRTLTQPTESIPGYRIESVIGKGAMGVVFRATQLNLGREVALKSILIHHLIDATAVGRFEQEARTIGQFRHPNIIGAYDLGKHSNRLYLAMELVDGHDLQKALMIEGPYDEFKTLGIIRQVISGLAHAARHQVVHRDIKPANLMLVDPPEGYPLPPGIPMVKIADFGLVLLQTGFSDETRLTTEKTLGSPKYMAPEQLESSDVDIRADMYALGITMMEMIADQTPFDHLNLTQLVALKLTKGPGPMSKLASNVSMPTCKLIDHLVCRDRSKRPASYEALLVEIDSVIESLGNENITGETQPFDSSQFSFEAGPTTIDVDGTSSVAQTQEIGEAKASSKSRRAKFLAVAGVVLAGVLGLVAYAYRPAIAPQPRRNQDIRTVGSAQLLFNGVDMGGWTILHGSWIWSQQKTALQGTNGVIRRLIPVSSTSDGVQPMSWYRLEFLLGGIDSGASIETTAQELHFGIDRNEQPAHILRRDNQGIHFLDGNGTARLHEGQPVQRDVPPDQLVAVALERLPGGWFLSINDEKFASALRHEGERPEIRLKAVDGPVFFSDALVTELAVGQAKPE